MEPLESKREDVPHNAEMEAHHKRQREITLEYLRDKTTRDERKTILKEAINEWLNEKYALVGVWTLRGMLAACIGLLGYAWLQANGWTHR